MISGKWAAMIVVGGMLMAGRVALGQQQPANPPLPDRQLSPRDARCRSPIRISTTSTRLCRRSSSPAIRPPPREIPARAGGRRCWSIISTPWQDQSRPTAAAAGARFEIVPYIGPTWDAVMAAVKPGDFVVIEFGHNSGPLPGIGEETQEVPGRGGRAPLPFTRTAGICASSSTTSKNTRESQSPRRSRSRR